MDGIDYETSPIVGPRQRSVRLEREKRSAGYPSAGHVDDGSNHPAKRRSSYPSGSAYNSPTRSLSTSLVPRRELPQDRDDPVEVQYRLFVYSSTEPDTLRPVVRLGTFEHVVSPSRPEEQRSRLRGDGQELRQDGSLGLLQW
uniref:Uncharacterized protein n=1 Tax=Hyaloperonospora arabidopsidis (strain Emoy2) TaxID=559515 RepID=M4C0Z8_HYAAE